MAEPFLGEIRLFSFNFAPRGWGLCDGGLLPINQNQSLFALLGTTYGGDGRVKFALPDLRGRTPVHMGDGYVQGQRAGEVAHTLSVSEIPQHTHIMSASGNVANSDDPTGRLLARSSDNLYATLGGGGSVTTMNSDSISSTGGSQPHTNMQPYLVINFCIALQGIFPSQN